MTDGAVVITTIFEPTAAVRAFAAMGGWRLVVAGDRRTPDGWRLDGARFLSAREQEGAGWRLASRLPWDHYCRKMLGYLCAIHEGAEVIYDVDDDNLPKDDWAVPALEGTFATWRRPGFVNVYSYFSGELIWPRGFPLQKIRDPDTRVDGVALASEPAKVGVWQGLADADPDVDAIWRLTQGREIVFRSRPPLVLAAGAVCPFNTQSTLFRREVFPLLYIPTTVTFRFCDILRGLVAQPILWRHGYRLGFHEAMVVQERNPHDGMSDFESEIPCYLDAHRVVGIVEDALSGHVSLDDQLTAAYGALARAGIVAEGELSVLEAWLEDLG